VPRGFIVSTSAYREFVKANKLDAVIQQALEELAPENADALENASQKIRTAFSQGKMPADITQEIQTAYQNLPHPESLSQRERDSG